MQIFVSDKNPVLAARNLDDKRVIKMILESAQLMSTAMHIHEIEGAPYKITHKNHPCAIWTRENSNNYRWLLHHFIALLFEYQLRYDKIHKCAQYVSVFTKAADKLPNGELTPFPNCTDFKQIKNVVMAYRVCLMDKWANDKRAPTWKTIDKPDWVNVITGMRVIKHGKEKNL